MTGWKRRGYQPAGRDADEPQTAVFDVEHDRLYLRSLVVVAEKRDHDAAERRRVYER